MITRKYNYLFVFIIIAIVVIVGLSINAYNIAYNQLVKSQEKSLTDLAEAVKTMIRNHWIMPREKSVEILAASPSLLGRIDGEVKFEELLQEWIPFFRFQEDVFFIYYADYTGFIEFYPPGDLPPDYNALARPWYILGMETPGQIRWSEPYLEAVTGEPVISTVKTIDELDTGQPLGVIAMDICLDKLEKMIQTIYLPEEGAVYLFHGNGAPLVFTDTNEEYIGFLGDLMANEQLKVDSSAYFPINDRDIFINLTHVPEVDWLLFFLVPQDTLLTAIGPIKTNAFLAALFLVIFFLFLVFILVFYQRKKLGMLVNYFLKVSRGAQNITNLFNKKDDYYILNREFNKAIKEIRKAEELRLMTERKYRELVENAPLGVFQLSRKGYFISVNQRLASMLGYSDATAAMQSLNNLENDLYVHPEDRMKLLDLLAIKDAVRDHQVQLKKRDGSQFWASVNARGIKDEEGKIQKIDGFIMDISMQVKSKTLLEEMANTDGLTKINNRRNFIKLARKQIDLINRYGGVVSLMIIDIDDFKQINDTFGHAIGDEVLKKLAKITLTSIRKVDIFGRIGGEEFAILLPQTDKKEAIILTERLRKSIAEELSVVTKKGEVTVTISVGVSSARNGGFNLESLMKVADKALYRAKKQGKDCVRYLGKKYS